MHRFRYTDSTLATSWTAPEGLHRLPDEVAERIGAQALVTIERRATLVAPYGLERLRIEHERCVATHGGEPTRPGELTWEQRATAGPTLLGDDPTREAPCDARPHRLMLIDTDGGPLPLEDDMTIIGRDSRCDVVLDDERVSSMHCVLLRVADGVRILDLGSTNGTFVADARIREAVVHHPVRLRLGSTSMALVEQDVAQSLTPLPSSAIRSLESMLARIAPSRAPVLVSGESGVGKDSVARRLHSMSGRSGQLITLNAAVVSPSLAASELFGHLRGSFTGADEDRPGAFVAAHGGTLFLDEVAELPLEVQAELLRAVERGVVRPVGSTREVEIDVRLVTATHADLSARVRTGQFREDLYHRICVIPVYVPPLRDRPEDLDAIADAFLSRQTPPRSLTPKARARLHQHRWPGNIRELVNVLQRACVLHTTVALREQEIELGRSTASATGLDELIHDVVVETYHATGGDVAETARRLGLQRTIVYRHVELNTRGRRRRRRTIALS